MNMEKINIAELLKNFPKGMELDCTISHGKVIFQYVELNSNFPIHAITEDGYFLKFTKYGELFPFKHAKCVIFPKGTTTWDGVQRPFVDGDIIYTNITGFGNEPKVDWVSIFKEVYRRICVTYVDVCISDLNTCYFHEGKDGLCNIRDPKLQRLATEEEKQKLFYFLKTKGYKWNDKTKTLEKLTVKFEVGDRIRHKTNTRQENVVTEIKDTHYILDNELALPFTCQDQYELVPNKFDITTLKPFDKVLCRQNEYCPWIISFFDSYDMGATTNPFICNNGFAYKHCIPYKSNEHLLGTTVDCYEYYKTWE